jgi:hypothetical protein
MVFDIVAALFIFFYVLPFLAKGLGWFLVLCFDYPKRMLLAAVIAVALFSIAAYIR